MAVRVYQIAKEYSRSAEEIMDILRSSGIPVSSHTAVLDQHALHTVRAKLGKFELTVVDGESKATIGSKNENKQKGGGKGKQQKKPAAPKLQVRIIKRDQQQENQEAEETAAETAPAKPKRPKLKKRKRNTSLEERINQAARQDEPAGASSDNKPEAKPDNTAATESRPADSARADAPDRGERRPPQSGDSRPPRGQQDRPQGDRGQRGGYGQRDGGGQRDGQRGGYGQRDGGGQRDGQRGGYGQRDGGGQRGGYGQRDGGGQRGGYGQRDGGGQRDGQRGGYSGGAGGGQRDGQRGGYSGGGGGGGQRGGYSGGGGGGGQRSGYSGGGGGGGQRGGYSSGGGGGGGQRGGYSGGGGGGGQRGGYSGGGGGGGQRGGYSGGGGGGGQRGGYSGGGGRGGQGGGNRPRGPRQPATTDMLREQFTMAQPQPGAAKANTMRLKGSTKPSARKKKNKKKRHEENISRMKPVSVSKVELPSEELGIIMLSEGVTVKELAEKVNRKAKDVIKRLFEKSIMATLNHVLEDDLAIEIAKDFGYEAEIVSFEEDLQLQEDESLTVDGNDGTEHHIERAPIVTIMGHVDHGKTTLLDAIRSTKVASGEAGGITQHIGAYAVNHSDKDIVFLDTPGHEAFTKMRARGASVTDIVILVVAADDGVKPQTVEAISHAKAARVPIIVCVNKIDKPEANPDRVKQMLTEYELVVEDFGGDSPCVLVSAKKGQGIDELLEMILLVAEMNNYKTNPTRKAKGTVIEGKLDRGRGPVASLIVQDGTLKIGDYYITGSTYGKIRAMHDDLGNNVEIATPSTPVEVLGIQEVPAAGDIFQVVDDEATARQVSAFRKEKVKEDQFRRQKHTSLDQLFSNLKQDEIKELRLIIKADVQGSLEGMSFALNKLESEKVNLRIVHQGVGSITENDVLLAAASDSIIIGFNTKGEKKAMELAEQEQIDVHFYSVIYEVVREIEAAMVGLIAPELREKDVGKAIVKQVFNVAKLGAVAGCMVETGYVKRDCGVRVMRGEDELFKGELATLKRFRDDVNEVKAGIECGIGIKDFSGFREQDQFVFFEMEKVMPTKL